MDLEVLLPVSLRDNFVQTSLLVMLLSFALTMLSQNLPVFARSCPCDTTANVCRHKSGCHPPSHVKTITGGGIV